MDRNEEESHRTIRKDDEEIRLIRPNEDNKQTSTGPLRRGDVTCCHHASTVDSDHTVTYGLRQRDLVLFTNKTLITVTFMLLY